MNKAAKKYLIKEGQNYFYWRVLEDPILSSPLIKCLCTGCDKTKYVNYTRLLNGESKSCGCKRKEVLHQTLKTQSKHKKYQIKKNDQFGFWKVLENPNPTKSTLLCLCLGCHSVEKEIRFYALLNRTSQSCGCQRKKIHKQTCLEKYGTENYSQTEEYKKRVRATNLERYGIGSFSQTKLFLEKTKKTNLSRFGVEFYQQTETAKKQRDAWNKNNPDRIQKAVIKRKKTMLQKYGVEHYPQHSNYREKSIKTNLDKYGVEFSSQRPDIALKSTKNRRNTYIRIHWKSELVLICSGSFEAGVVDYFNHHKIDFKWQPKTFLLSTSKTYRPDLYLPLEKKWIEIKGLWLREGKEKWNEFHREIRPNSELWDYEKLREKKIINYCRRALKQKRKEDRENTLLKGDSDV